MPTIVDYPVVLDRLLKEGWKCHYFNGGAFGLGNGVQSFVRGWIGPEDATIRPEGREFVRSVPEPFESNLAELAGKVWIRDLAGPVWVMPASHWGHELNHGSKDWMPGVLGEVGLKLSLLEGRTDASAIEFMPSESALFCHFVKRLLEKLEGSDFVAAFPGRGTICSIHHHKQLWWTSSDRGLMRALDGSLRDKESL